MKCDRCKKPTPVTQMSWFNTDALCDPCREEERVHPDYEEARAVETAAVKRGDYNFPGIGWPR